VQATITWVEASTKRSFRVLNQDERDIARQQPPLTESRNLCQVCRSHKSVSFLERRRESLPLAELATMKQIGMIDSYQR